MKAKVYEEVSHHVSFNHPTGPTWGLEDGNHIYSVNKYEVMFGEDENGKNVCLEKVLEVGGPEGPVLIVKPDSITIEYR